MSAAPKHARRRFQFSLGTMLLLVATVALGLGLAREHRKCMRAEATIELIEGVIQDGAPPDKKSALASYKVRSEASTVLLRVSFALARFRNPTPD